MNLVNSILAGMFAAGIINIYKDNLNKKNYVIDKNKVKKLSKLDLKKIPVKDVKIKYDDKIKEFYNVIHNKLPYVSLDNFNRNLQDLLICEEKPNKTGILGKYNALDNIIYLLENDMENSIFHELFHMSSSVFDGKIFFSGFSQKSNDFSIGTGIAEGYTALLTKRYFKQTPDIYILFSYITTFIEKIIGSQKMIKMYFEADLYSLIEELSKYCNKNMAYELIKNIDILYEFEYGNKSASYIQKNIDKYQEVVVRIAEILLSCYINRVKFDVKRGLVKEKNMKYLILDFTDDLRLIYKINNVELKFMPQELYDDIYNKYFNTKDGSKHYNK